MILKGGGTVPEKIVVLDRVPEVARAFAEKFGPG